MNKVEAVAALVGSKYTPLRHNQFTGNNAALAKVLKKHPAAITRMVASGEVPFRHTATLMEWAGDNGLVAEIWPLLEHKCPCCGHDALAM